LIIIDAVTIQIVLGRNIGYDVWTWRKEVAAEKELAKKLWGKWRGLYYTVGKYEFVAIAELPAD